MRAARVWFRTGTGAAIRTRVGQDAHTATPRLRREQRMAPCRTRRTACFL